MVSEDNQNLVTAILLYMNGGKDPMNMQSLQYYGSIPNSFSVMKTLHQSKNLHWNKTGPRIVYKKYREIIIDSSSNSNWHLLASEDGIVVPSHYSLSLHWLPWWKWLWRPNLLLRLSDAWSVKVRLGYTNRTDSALFGRFSLWGPADLYLFRRWGFHGLGRVHSGPCSSILPSIQYRQYKRDIDLRSKYLRNIDCYNL